VALPQPDSRVLLRQCVEGFDHFGVVFCFELVLVRAPWQLHEGARLADAALLHFNEVRSSFSFLSRRYNFFSMKFLIALFSKVSSPTNFLY
jgi:hypothetical protein